MCEFATTKVSEGIAYSDDRLPQGEPGTMFEMRDPDEVASFKPKSAGEFTHDLPPILDIE